MLLVSTTTGIRMRISLLSESSDRGRSTPQSTLLQEDVVKWPFVRQTRETRNPTTCIFTTSKPKQTIL